MGGNGLPIANLSSYCSSLDVVAQMLGLIGGLVNSPISRSVSNCTETQQLLHPLDLKPPDQLAHIGSRENGREEKAAVGNRPRRLCGSRQPAARAQPAPGRDQRGPKEGWSGKCDGIALGDNRGSYGGDSKSRPGAGARSHGDSSALLHTFFPPPKSPNTSIWLQKLEQLALQSDQT